MSCITSCVSHCIRLVHTQTVSPNSRHSAHSALDEINEYADEEANEAAPAPDEYMDLEMKHRTSVEGSEAKDDANLNNDNNVDPEPVPEIAHKEANMDSNNAANAPRSSAEVSVKANSSAAAVEGSKAKDDANLLPVRQQYFQRREYVSKKKLRIPSWCDRVLHRTMPGGWVYFVR